MLLLITLTLKFQVHSLRSSHCFGFQVKVGCCTVDVIKQLSGEMISRNPTDRMTAIANHILSQRRQAAVTCLILVGLNNKYFVTYLCFTLFSNSFYPLYPPAETIPLDFSIAPEALEIPAIPDILIIPSDLAYFVKVNIKTLISTEDQMHQKRFGKALKKIHVEDDYRKTILPHLKSIFCLPLWGTGDIHGWRKWRERASGVHLCQSRKTGQGRRWGSLCGAELPRESRQYKCFSHSHIGRKPQCHQTLQGSNRSYGS